MNRRGFFGFLGGAAVGAAASKLPALPIAADETNSDKQFWKHPGWLKAVQKYEDDLLQRELDLCRRGEFAALRGENPRLVATRRNHDRDLDGFLD